MSLELFDFQREDVDRFKNENQKAGLIGYDMALGKTLTATTLGVELKTDVNLIVAPQITFDGWETAVLTQTDGEHQLRWIKNSSKAGVAALEDFYAGVPGWYFVTWQLMRGGTLFETKADLVIADEVHEIQNAGTSSQNILIKKIESTYRLGLSGTAAGNKQEGIFGTIEWLWPKVFTSYWKWLKRNFFLAGSGYAMKPIREKKPGQVTGELPFYVRRLKEDHYSDMIPKPLPLKKVRVTLSDEQRRIYDKFDQTSGAWLNEDNIEDGFLYTSTSIVKTGRLREIALANPVIEYDEDGQPVVTFREDAESAKLDRMIEIIKSRPGQPFVVYTHSKKFIPVAVKRLEEHGITARAFTGDLNYKQKRKAIDEFGDKFRVLIATQSSVGTGTDGLQYKSSKLIWASRDVKVSVNTQAKDRLYRPGQKDPIEQWELVADDTKDEDTNDYLDLQEELVNDMLNANRIKK